MKVAVVHDWLTVYGGAEKVLTEILKLFPEADLFSVVDFFPEELRHHLHMKQARTSFIQRLPFAKKAYRNYLPLMPLAVEQLDVTEYDLILSSSSAVAKGVLTGPGQCHLCYCHSPLRYAWDLQFHYLDQMRGLNKTLAAWMLHKLRLWDTRTANGVDAFMANSRFVSERIQKYYGRPSEVVHPPVDLDHFPLKHEKDDFYFTVSRLVSYKNISLIVEAFRSMPGKKLFVAGEGPEMKRIAHLRPPNVTILGHQSQELLADYLGKARAFIFAAVEDFGIAPLEAQACGTPVIAYGKGGVLETIRGQDSEIPTGYFYKEQSAEGICNAVNACEKLHFSPDECRKNAERFSKEQFQKTFSEFVHKWIKS